jgi:hypothetical protein
MLEKLVWIRWALWCDWVCVDLVLLLLSLPLPLLLLLLSHPLLLLLLSLPLLLLLLLLLLLSDHCSAFMLVGAKHKLSVGEVESQCPGEVGALMRELAAAGAAALGVEVAPGMTERLMAYARSVAHFPTAVKEFEWRNGYFWGLTQAALAEGRPDPCPLHTSLLKEVGAV